MGAEQNRSLAIVNANSVPIVRNNTGAGAIGTPRTQDGVCAVAAIPVQSVKSVYRLVRFPSDAILKSVLVATDTALDTGTHALVMDFNIAFSDSTTDGTPTAFLPASAGEAVIPTSARDGVTMTTVAAYSSPNLIFGQVTMAPSSIRLKPTEILLQGSIANYSFLALTQQPIWQSLGLATDPDGNFDLLAYVSTGAGTGAAGNLYGRVNYVQ
jgi:hypothetical protein